MKLREQATLLCKILGLFCVVMAVSSLQSSLAQMFSLMGTRGATPGVGTLLMASAPAILMGAFGGGSGWSSLGNSFMLRAALESLPDVTRNGMASYYGYQMSLGWISAIVEFGFGTVVFLLSRWLPRRIFPAS